MYKVQCTTGATAPNPFRSYCEADVFPFCLPLLLIPEERERSTGRTYDNASVLYDDGASPVFFPPKRYLQLIHTRWM